MVGGLDVLTEIESVETDKDDKPKVNFNSLFFVFFFFAISKAKHIINAVMTFLLSIQKTLNSINQRSHVKTICNG